ncbi:uncharacterized protein TRIVIDRAFT_204313 [Trichoderma virens Gv29-8]|uniref:BTB domain-containing protein n=1 Tax=Hypocrea virens (strain Gv29-8 / FGSC 10586) TaxID=413071 RepID=G9N3M5_HYPVG|nr:uncharacterized protein TRIVIDRAFT_204313 [Trichoderma virens Gv29-8]EHK18909.1 hypothetical protein TRIVIDRAFT_204313 [Trichoderma virens Gv29-8]UKZ56685.1 hypothetical protein TrVGV298_010525 [Trichoderma virens]
MDEYSRPETSPYEVPSVALYFANGCTLYISPRLLAQSPKLERYLLNPSPLLDISKDAGHVLVHYLTTGSYQSLKSINLSPQEEVVADFLTGIHVYTAAKTFVLPNLVELAKAEIERLGGRLQLSLVFDLLRDAYPDPETNDVWIGNYLKNRLKCFLTDGIIEPLASEADVRYKTASISDILFKTILELFQENKASMRNEYIDILAKTALAAANSEPEPIDLVDKPVVKSNMKTGETGGDLNGSDDNEWGFHPKNKKKGKTTNAVHGFLEEEESEDISTQDIAANLDKKIEKSFDSVEQPEGKGAEERAAYMAVKAAEAAAIAEEEAEIAQLIDKRDNFFLGLSTKAEERLHHLQAKAKKRAEEQAVCEVELTVREVEQAAKENKWRGKKGKKGSKNNNNNNNNSVAVVDPQPSHLGDYFVVKTQQEIKHDDEKENKDDSRASGHKSPKGEKKKQKKNTGTNDPIIQSSAGDPAVGPWQDIKCDGVKEILNKEGEGWSFWGLGKREKGDEKALLEISTPPCNAEETKM